MFSPKAPGGVSNIFRNKNLYIWLGGHLLLILLFLFTGGLSVGTSLYAILPETNELKELIHVEEEMAQRMNRNITILVGSPEFSVAKERAEALILFLEDLPGIQEVTGEVDQQSLGNIQDFLHEYRHRALSTQSLNALENGDISTLQQNAFFYLSSPFSMGGLDHLDEDPFLLAQDKFQDFIDSTLLSSNAMDIKESMLHREYQGKHWILITAKTSLSGSAVEIKENPLELILEQTSLWVAQDNQLEYLLSGVPFHSYLSAKKSQREISLLSTLSTVFILLLIIMVFRSLQPLWATLCSIGLGVVSGLISCGIVFDEVNIFTIVFGTSLIGITVDYSFHYFTHWAQKSRLGSSIRKEILPGITVGLLTTLISYGSFFFCPFPLMRQIALFSMVGLISSFSTVALFYPLLNPSREKTLIRVNKAASIIKDLFQSPSNWPRWIKMLLALGILLYLFLGFQDFSIQNRLSDYYTMGPQMLRWEQASREIIDHGSSGIYLTVQGETLQQCLERSESMGISLSALQNSGELGSFVALHQFLPSKMEQQRHYQLVEENMLPHVRDQLLALGYGQEHWQQNFSDNKNHYIDLQSLESLPINSLMDSLYLGKIDSAYYINILLFDLTDLKALEPL
nr:hypothetical protein [Spirochaetaceae bacterium]